MALIRRSPSPTNLPWKTRLLYGLGAWALLIAFLMVGVSTSAPPWVRTLGWLLMALLTAFWAVHEVRLWNVRRIRRNTRIF